jgi:hypothetical protein
VQFEETSEKAQWRKFKQMQPMRLCHFSSSQFEDTFENAVEKNQTNAIYVIMPLLVQAI